MRGSETELCRYWLQCPFIMALWLELGYQNSQKKAQHFAVLIMEARISYIPAPAPLPAINPCLTNEKRNTTNKWHVELQHEWSPTSYGLVPCGSLALIVKVWKSCGFSYNWILKSAGMQILRYHKNCALLLQLFLQTQTYRIWSQSSVLYFYRMYGNIITFEINVLLFNFHRNQTLSSKAI